MTTYTKEFIVEDFLCRDEELPLNHILNYFIETSNCQSRYLGLSNEKLMAGGQTWMVYKWKVKILRAPRSQEKIRVVTWASGFKSLMAFREFEMYGGSEKIATASANFLLIDLKTRRPINIPKEIFEIYKINDVKNFDRIERINEPRSIEPINNFDYIILKRDIDLNDHMNNSVYAELLYEALPDKFSDLKFREVNINYTKELRLGDHVFIDVYFYEGKFYFFFKNSEKTEIYARLCCQS